MKATIRRRFSGGMRQRVSIARPARIAYDVKLEAADKDSVRAAIRGVLADS